MAQCSLLVVAQLKIVGRPRIPPVTLPSSAKTGSRFSCAAFMTMATPVTTKPCARRVVTRRLPCASGQQLEAQPVLSVANANSSGDSRRELCTPSSQHRSMTAACTLEHVYVVPRHSLQH